MGGSLARAFWWGFVEIFLAFKKNLTLFLSENLAGNFSENLSISSNLFN